MVSDADGVAAGEVEATDDGADARGVRALASDDFSVLDSVGGVRGLVESMLPGLVFVVVYVLTSDLTATLWASVAVAVLLVVARLVARTPPVHALGGLVGVGIGVLWAATSHRAENYYAVGLLTNAAYLVGCLVTILVRWPAVGVVVELLRSGMGGATLAGGKAPARPTSAEVEAAQEAQEPLRPTFPTAWRADRELVRRYAWATWVWVAMFGLRLAVQVPLYLDHSVGWLGTARLVMGLPLWGLTLWVTWILIPHRARQVAAPA
ncbi:DUF3159 domain-containing protein [Luteimicrobium xylanilyticum]|uniref:DUF3159 domain-containing protein n=1 Tax=Luteimicrobium xylanilyticum TaxID=1133546 RepID=A0A5P9QB47_9MICO|nr:DUF3159 domain-containing protein [Luteimicrobium xylanilyticum]QFU98456.1 hypothetical protein KDY119_01972 [Luteimicrobium xylanilyticum]